VGILTSDISTPPLFKST